MRPWRHILWLNLLALLPLCGKAEKIVFPQTIHTRFETVETAGSPRVYVFANLSDAQMQTSASANWYEFPNLTTPVARGYNTFTNLKDGSTYLVEMGAQKDTFVVFDYRKYRLGGKELKANLTCEDSYLFVDVAPMTYSLLNGQTRTLEREFVVSYTNLIQDSVSWKETEIEDTIKVSRPREINLKTKILMQTQFDLVGDRFAEAFYDEPDVLRVTMDNVRAVAIDFIPKSYTALRGKDPENENMRVVDESVLSGSAPLNILFRANATPLTDFYSWDIKRSTDLLSNRTENETRYIFEESGKYSVYLKIWNTDSCSCDTTFQVDAKESLLVVPNVFTPNGDGVNDEFRVLYRSLRSFNIWIYNRWQHLIYESNDPAKGWDGRINGKKAPESAYFYIIEAKGTDGEKYKRSGAINLLR